MKDDKLVGLLSYIHTLETSDKRLILSFLELVENRQHGKPMLVRSAREYNEIKDWAHEFFKEGYQNGLLLANHALTILDEIKIA